MKTFLINFYVKHRADTGYAIINAPNITIAQKILETLGKEACHGYKVLSSKLIDLPCAPLTLVHEGVTTTGLSAYLIAVKYGYKGTEELWIKDLQSDSIVDTDILKEVVKDEIDGRMDSIIESLEALKYHPSENIPNGTMSEEHGYMQASSKESLDGMSFSTLFDKILFKEHPAEIIYNLDGNTIVSNTTLEVGESYNASMFTVTTAEANYKYPVGTLSWLASDVTVPSGTASFGSNSNVGTVTFTLNWNNLNLTTSYGAAQSGIVPQNKSIIKKAAIQGYYAWGWSYSQGTDYTKSTTTSNLSNKQIDCNRDAQYVYVALPVSMVLSKVKLYDSLQKIYIDSTNFDKVESNKDMSALSSRYRFNIWRIHKTLEDNADGSVTPNNVSIQITTT